MATHFQQCVWDEIARIPYGQTRSYTFIAQAIGKPTAARAVANACSQNPTPITIPCHRVIASDGSIGGYRYGGPHIKQALLDVEAIFWIMCCNRYCYLNESNKD